MGIERENDRTLVLTPGHRHQTLDHPGVPQCTPSKLPIETTPPRNRSGKSSNYGTGQAWVLTRRDRG